jgi:hypothetical protein
MSWSTAHRKAIKWWHIGTPSVWTQKIKSWFSARAPSYTALGGVAMTVMYTTHLWGNASTLGTTISASGGHFWGVWGQQLSKACSKASFTRSGVPPAGWFRLSPDKVVEHGKAYAYSHNPVVWLAGNLPAGCRVATGSIHCYARSPAGRWVSSCTCVAHRDVPHSDFYPAVSER